MDNNENNQPVENISVNPEIPAVPETPAHTPQKPTAALKWIKILCGLFAVSIICAVALIFSNHKKTDGKTDGLDSLLSGAGKEGIGWINVRGVIMDSSGNSIFDKGAASIARNIRAMADKKNVKAIVLDINSPGGSTGAVQEVYDAVLYAKNVKKKPIVSMFRDVAASGGYYIAAPSDVIIAQPASITGSIGVIFSLGNLQGLFKKIGVSMEIVKRGKFKDMGSPYREITAEERAMLQALVEDTYQQFYSVVKTGRNLPDEKLREYCDGRIFSGKQALDYGFVDKLGGSIEAQAAAGKLAGLGDNPDIIKENDSLESVLELFSVKANITEKTIQSITSAVSPSVSYLWAY
ncbi:MAG: signal peptide peptidase SppA [Elusimicrobiaceae bacterium]